MIEMLPLSGQGVRALIAGHPVTRAAYKEYLRATGQPLPPSLRGGGAAPPPPSSPVTFVSQVDARAYCRWLGAQEARPYRLPTMAELQELHREDAADGISPELWPHMQGDRPELRGGMKDVYLCEWTDEVEEVPQPDQRPPHVLGSIFYPPWLRDGSNAVHAQAHLLSTGGYSFVTFRVACDA